MQIGPGNNSNTGQWNLCPGADGKTHHDCRINMTQNWIRMVNPSGNGNGGYSAVRNASTTLSGISSCSCLFAFDESSWLSLLLCAWMPTNRWRIFIIQCAPPSWWDDAIDNRPNWYPRNAAYPCWTVDTTNWMNGQLYLGLPNNTPGWPGWIHGVTWCVVEIVSSFSPSLSFISQRCVFALEYMYAGDRSFRRTHTQRGSGRLM